FGISAWGWHLVNVLIHAAVAFFVFAVCAEITGRNWPAITAAAIFAVHPVHAESVAFLSGITDPLIALFLLPAFYFYLRFLKSGRKYMIALSVALYFFALLGKETAILLPLLIVYCEVIHFKDSAPLRQRIVRATVLAGLFILPTSIYLLMRYH